MAEYNQYLETLSKLSADTSRNDKNGDPEVMTMSSALAVDYDKFQEIFLKEISSNAEKPESVDAYCILNGKHCLIEFKNGEIDKKQVKNKIISSVSCIVFKDNIEPQYFMQNSLFILVYNKENMKKISNENYNSFNEQQYLQPTEINISSSKSEFYNLLGRKAKEPVVLFKLNMYKNLFFSKVMTMDKEIFEEYIKDKTITIPEN